MMVTRDGEVTWPPPEPEEPAPPPDAEEPADEEEPTEPAPPTEADQPSEAEPTDTPSVATLAWVVLAGTLLLLLLGVVAPPSFIQHLTVFVLACFVGWQVIWNVTSSLHTPLMSVTNAISGIIIVGGLLQVTTGASLAVLILGAAAIAVASINIFGGFFVTQRMLGMFRAEREEQS
jgi:NAD(P) transhydrogenase subunit alpha